MWRWAGLLALVGPSVFTAGAGQGEFYVPVWSQPAGCHQALSYPQISFFLLMSTCELEASSSYSRCRLVGVTSSSSRGPAGLRVGGQGSSGAMPMVLPRTRFSLTSTHEAHVDQKNKVVTTPAFMCETALHHIHDGIGAMVKKVLELTGK